MRGRQARGEARRGEGGVRGGRPPRRPTRLSPGIALLLSRVPQVKRLAEAERCGVGVRSSPLDEGARAVVKATVWEESYLATPLLLIFYWLTLPLTFHLATHVHNAPPALSVHLPSLSIPAYPSRPGQVSKNTATPPLF